MDDNSQFTPTCNVCARLCGVSLYGCIDCNFSAHVECIGFPINVKNQRHRHIVTQMYSMFNDRKCCFLCGSKGRDWMYSCKNCSLVFHMECIIPMGYRKAAGEEKEQQQISIVDIDLQKLLGPKIEYQFV
ncbi:Cysteine/Histidine-rich C1 domain family protein [Raphanus sativus]|nr:Cysteine/Histidine-rich C1 domain family protein [Raphanus sativus]